MLLKQRKGTQKSLAIFWLIERLLQIGVTFHGSGRLVQDLFEKNLYRKVVFLCRTFFHFHVMCSSGRTMFLVLSIPRWRPNPNELDHLGSNHLGLEGGRLGDFWREIHQCM